MALFNKNDKDDRDSLWRQVFHGASYEDAKAGVKAKNLILGILGALAVLAIVIFGAVEIISSVAVAITEKQQENCEHKAGYDLDTVSISEEQKRAFADCKDCGKRLYVEATVEIANFEEPTCTADGIRTEVWTFVGLPGVVHDKLYYIPKTDHEIGNYLYSYSAPTCQLEGRNAEGYCSQCGKRVGGEAIPKLECDFVRYGYVNATCSSSGMTGYEECTMCNTKRGANESIPTLSHKAVSGNFEATYETGAFSGSKCELCNTPLEISEMKSEPKAADYFDYETVDGEYIVIRAVKKSAEEIVIPNKINGIPVALLADGLFENNTEITKVTLSENLRELGERVFNGCERLREINIPASVASIGEKCFMGCGNLRKISIENAAIEAYAFSNCFRLREVVLGSSVDYVGEYAFENCLSILFLRISTPADSINISPDAFYGIESVYTLHFPEGVVLGIDSEYAHCYDEVSAYKKYYTEENGCYFGTTFDVKTLIAIDTDGTLARITDGSINIFTETISRSPLIEALVVPKSVKTIEYSYSERAIDIFYEGDENDWSLVEYHGINNFSQDGINYVPVYAEIYYYSDDEPELSGCFWHYGTDGAPEIWQ